MELGYTKKTQDSYEEAIRRVEEATEHNGFKVVNRLDMGGILNSKGFPRDPVYMLEICHAPSASEVLQANMDISLLLPCKINVYLQDGETYISALDPGIMAQFFKEDAITQIASHVGQAIHTIVDEAAR